MARTAMHPDSKTNSAPRRILVVDDDPGQRSLLESFLSGQNFEVVAVDSGKNALEVLDGSAFDLMISDVRMPGMSGLEMFRLARRKHPSLPVLLVTAYADIRDAVAAMRDGALNYLAKPIDLDELFASARHATGLSKNEPLKFSEDKQLPPHVVAASPLMQSVLRDASLIAASDSRVLITGESGVGKEVVADIIHFWSKRSGRPIVKVNCAAIPETLLESELFGHEKGSFTGATALRIGRFEQATGGTILLDEIGEMSPSLQAKLLRITHDGSFHRVGSNTEIQANVRILAATNRNLEEEVAKGRFREDLFYRLNVIELNIPPLHDRAEDILPLANLFLSQFCPGRGRLSSLVVECLKHYSWPGNVRELQNAMERASLLSRGELILPDHLPARITDTLQKSPSLEHHNAEKLQEIEDQALLDS
ncbi:MAG: sigma-54 dependent transcriptional regulator, partial [Verrucomicrobiota bacterium]